MVEVVAGGVAAAEAITPCLVRDVLVVPEILSETAELELSRYDDELLEYGNCWVDVFVW